MSEIKKRGRKSTNPYWGLVQENAVKEFLTLGIIIEQDVPNTEFSKIPQIVFWSGTSEEQRLRNKIYKDHLMKPLNKMVESIIRRYKLYSKTMDFEDLHADTLSFLMIKFHKFKPSKNKKSYSYYGTVIKHYLLGSLIKDDKKSKLHTSYEDISTSINDDERHSYTIEEDSLLLTKFINKISESIKKELSENILNENELRVGNSLVSILENWENLFDTVPGGNKFNKNLILYYMREMTSLSTKDIRNAMKRYKSIYNLLKEDLI